MAGVSKLVRPRMVVVAMAVIGVALGVGLALRPAAAPSPAQPAALAPVVTAAVHQDVSAPLAMIPDTGNAGPMEGLICKPEGEEGEEDNPGDEVKPNAKGLCPEGFFRTIEGEEDSNSAEAQRESHYPRPNIDPQAVDTVVQTKRANAPTLTIPATATSWDGLGNGFVGPNGTMTVNSAPPDTTMDVSPTQVVEVVNTQLAVFNKSGTVLYGPVATNTLWSGFGGLCQSNNDGDPIVQWDRLSGRWVITQFAVSGADGAGTPFLECVAVSQTADATGAWYRYSFPYSFFNDYPKLSVWPDAYYITFNGFNAAGTAFVGGTTCAYEKAQMLAGGAARQVCFTEPSYGGILVAGVEGPTPPTAGTAAYAIALETTAAMAVWRFHVDWVTTANSTWTKQTSVGVASFALPCAGGGGTCIPQITTTQKLDTLGDRLMFRFVYRKVNTTELLALSHSVNSSNSTSNVRWYEFLPSGSTLATYDQGTYAPDTASRWMPSVALDQAGNLAMVYSTSSSTTTPSIRYAGRLLTDTAGTLGQGEATLTTGAGYQSTGLSRWGDYAAIGVDPSDDCTFWFASEYIPSAGTFNWKTRIGSFKYASCGVAAPTVSSFTSAVTSPTNSTSIAYTLTFSESVSGIAAGDFTNAGTATGCTFTPSAASGTSVTVTVTTCSTTGTLTPQIAANAVTGSSTTGPASATNATTTLTLDRVAPTVSSFSSAVTSPTNSTSIAYTLTFGESVSGIAAGDFTNAGTATGCTFTPSAASGTSITVTATTCSTTGTLQPQLAANGVTDTAGNTGPASASAATTTLTLDRVAPTVSSFSSAVTSPTNSTSIAYTLTFSESVSGIAAGDFTNAGTATGCTFTPSASSATGGVPITVTITTCAASGTLTPKVWANGVTDAAGNTGPTADANASTSLTLDRIAPTVITITPAPLATNGAVANFAVTFSESVTGVASGNFSLAVSGVSGASIAGVTGSGASWSVAVNTGTGDGTIRLDLSSATPAITDGVGNALSATFNSGTSITVDKTAPTVVSFSSAVTSPTNSTSIAYTLTFSEAVSGLTFADFSNLGTATSCSYTPSAASGTTITVTVTTCSTSGTLQLQLAANGVADAAGNTGPASASAATTTLTLDRVAPTVSSFTSAVSSPTNSTSIAYTLTFGESVSGIAAGDFTNAGTATGCTFTPSAASGTSITVTVTTCSTTGTLQPQLAVNGVTDTAGNTGPTPSAVAATTTLTLDRVAPTVSSIAPTVAGTNAATASFTVTFSEAVTGVATGNFSLTLSGVTGASVTGVTGSGSTRTVTISTGAGNGTIRLDLSSATPSIADTAGNALTATFTGGSTLTVDLVPPTVSSFSSAVTSPTNSTSIAYTLTFSESVTGIIAGDFTNAGTATGCTFTPSAASGSSVTVTVTTCSTSGTLQPQLAALGVADTAGNTGPASAATATTTLTLDRVAPTVSSFTSAVTSPTNSTSIAYSLTFSEDVSGIVAGDFTNAGTAVTCVFTPSAATAAAATPITVTVTGCGTTGTLQPQLAANGVTDTAGNTGPASASAATTTLTLDRVAPTVSSFTSAVTSPTNSTSIAYTLTFSESVSGIAAGDFTNAGTATGCTFTPSAASGSSVTVTVTTCGSSGTLQPQLALGGVTDTAGNTGPASAASATTTLTLDRVAPSVSVFSSAVSSPTNSTSVAYTLTFSESVSGIAASDFTNAGTATGCTFTPSGASGTTVTVTVTTCSTSGTLQPQLGAGLVTDTAGNVGPISSAAATTTLTLDRVAPTVSSITISPSLTSASSVSFTVTFAESVTGAAIGNFSLTSGGAVSGASVTGVSGSGATRTVTVNTGTGDGTIRLDLSSASPAITDAAGNSLAATYTSGTVLTVSRTAPTATVVPAATITNAATLSYTITFSQTVTGLQTSDFSLAGTAAGCTIGTLSGSGTGYTLTVTGCGDGTAILTLLANTVVNGTSVSGPVVDVVADTVTRDATPPTAELTSPWPLTHDATLTYGLVFSEPVTGLGDTDFAVGGSATGCVVGTPTGSGTTWSVDLTGCSEGSVDLSLNAGSVTDAASNAGPSAVVWATATVLIDRTAPAVVSITAPASPTAPGTLSYSLVFSEAIYNLEAGDIVIGGTATGCTVDAPTGSGASWTITVSSCSLGTVTFQLAALTVGDGANNAGPTSAFDANPVTIALDSTGPTFTTPISVVLRAGASLSTAATTSAIPVTISWLAADEVGGSGLDHYTLERSLSGGAWTTIALATPLTTSLATTMPTSGTVAYRVTAYDVMGNPSLASATAALTPRITQQTSTAVKWTGAWYLTKASSMSGGSVKYSKVKYASSSYTFTGKGIGFVAIKGTGRGYVKIYIDGKYKTQVSLYKTGSAQSRLLAWQMSWATSGKHTIKLVVAGTAGRPRVDVDAFVVMK